MRMGNDIRSVALERLDAFVGSWRMEASFQTALPAAAMSSTDAAPTAIFEWALGGRFLIQRTDVPQPAPNSLAIISVDAESNRYTQHYFDSRGVVRVYAMTFDGRTWTLLRDAPDFSPLEFSQRFTGTFSDDGTAIVGRWEMSRDGSHWDHDFDLSYSRVT
jgi:hypothetical protein